MDKPASISAFFRGVTNSYSQVFFSDNLIFAIILIFISFIDPGAGLAGLSAVIITNFIALNLGFNKIEIEKGLYGFNSLLVGLGIGYFFAFSPELFLVIIISSFLTLMLVTFFKGILQKYGLPYLSIPFLFGLWTILIAANYLEALGISQKGIYTLNNLYGLGGVKLISFYEFFNNIHIAYSLKVFFTSIAAIFFQFSVLAGIVLSIGLLIFSRIAFLLAVYGFYIAYFTYRLLGGNLSDLGYSYIGFNYILTAIAIGGFFIVPSRKSFFWLLILIPVVTLISLSLSKVFAVFNLSVYSLPFNIVVLLFIYSLKFRIYPSDSLSEVSVQYNSPEKNLYNWIYQKNRKMEWTSLKFNLPFHGAWIVSQAHDGPYTHKAEWRHAWDFVIRDTKDSEYENDGDYAQDYYCYGKSVLAPADGIIADIQEDIPDNDIGRINLENNWGNTVVIKHSDFLYSSLSHLRPGSVKVKKEEKITAGTKIGEVGNSGRSPYPHLHFQFQATAFIGSKTIDYPFSHYILTQDNQYSYKTFEKPRHGERLMNPDFNSLLKKKLGFIPGQIMQVNYTMNGKTGTCTWEVFTTPYNKSYLYDKESESYAWFINTGDALSFAEFSGNTSTILYYFYLGFNKVLFSWYRGLVLREEIPQYEVFHFPLLFIQDFIAPFYIFLKTRYSLNYLESDNEFQASEMTLFAELENLAFNRKVKSFRFELNISKEKILFKMHGGEDIEAEIS